MILELFTQGISRHLSESIKQEALKIGTLRAGNTGMLDREGKIWGQCAGEAWLRMKGINGTPIDLSKELMFSGGRLNEEHWLTVLKEAWTGPIKCEDDIPTCWTTNNGTKVTGRPDIILLNSNNEIVRGLELKQVMSVNSAYNVLIKQEPQLKHLMQACHYMWQLDCSFELWYTNRNQLDMPGWMEFRSFPNPGEPGSECLSYRYYRFGEINPKTNKPIKHKIAEADYLSQNFDKTFAQASKIAPFIRGFKLRLENGRLYYQRAEVPGAEWKETIVTVENIIRFYEFVSEMEEYGKVPNEALNSDAFGNLLGWKFSDYSYLGKLGPAYTAGRPLKEWFEEVKQVFPKQELV